MDKHIVFGIHVSNRATKANSLQELFTEYGCNIKTRIGLHHVDEKFCSPNALMILEMYGEEKLISELFNKVSKIEGVQIQKMVFDH